MSVLFRNTQKIVKVSPSSVSALAHFVLEQQGASEKEVSVLFVDDAEINELNIRHLGRNSPTDVLAFPMCSEDNADLYPEILGDVVVSAERAACYSKEHGMRLEDELSLYLIHGLLHLLGYDDVKGADARRMRRREQKLLREAASRGLTVKTK